MNAVLFLAILFHCHARGGAGYDACVEKTMACAAEGGAYRATEAKAVEILARCVAPEKKK